MMKNLRRLTASFSLVLATGCTSSGPRGPELPASLGALNMDAPKILQLQMVPDRVELGCPVRISLRFEDAPGDAVRVVARWYGRHGRVFYRGSVTLPVERAALWGKVAGEVTAELTLEQPGDYLFKVQIEDALGNRSEAAEAEVFVWRRLFGSRSPICVTGEGIDRAVEQPSRRVAAGR